MTCPQLEATVAWCHGEGDDASALAHLAACAECRQVVDELEVAWAAVAATRHAPRIVRSDRRMWWVAAVAAAAVLLGVFAPRPAPDPLPRLEPVDEALVDLELALDDLGSDLEPTEAL